MVVLEAGEEDTKNPAHNVPLDFFALQNTEVDWAYRTVPQKKACLGMEGQVCHYCKKNIAYKQIVALWQKNLDSECKNILKWYKCTNSLTD